MFDKRLVLATDLYTDSFKEESFYWFQEDKPNMPKNKLKVFREKANDPTKVIGDLVSIVNQILVFIKNKDSKSDIENMRNSHQFRHYVNMAAELQRVDLNLIS